MTEQEHKLLENLTKQLELSNKIALKQMQEPINLSINEERLLEAEINLTNEKERLCKRGADILFVIYTILILGATTGFVAAFIGIAACAGSM